jgi:hypothetical protein
MLFAGLWPPSSVRRLCANFSTRATFPILRVGVMRRVALCRERAGQQQWHTFIISAQCYSDEFDSLLGRCHVKKSVHLEEEGGLIALLLSRHFHSRRDFPFVSGDKSKHFPHTRGRRTRKSAGHKDSPITFSQFPIATGKDALRRKPKFLLSVKNASTLFVSGGRNSNFSATDGRRRNVELVPQQRECCV